MNMYCHSSPGKRWFEDIQRVVNPARYGATAHSKSSDPAGTFRYRTSADAVCRKLEPYRANFNVRMLAAPKRDPEKSGWVRIVQI